MPAPLTCTHCPASALASSYQIAKTPLFDCHQSWPCFGPAGAVSATEVALAAPAIWSSTYFLLAASASAVGAAAGNRTGRVEVIAVAESDRRSVPPVAKPIVSVPIRYMPEFMPELKAKAGELAVPSKARIGIVAVIFEASSRNLTAPLIVTLTALAVTERPLVPPKVSEGA